LSIAAAIGLLACTSIPSLDWPEQAFPISEPTPP
jgi:hypothetical protein